MKKEIVAGMFLIFAIALTLGFAQLYPGASEAAEMECEGGADEAISPNETGYENITWIKDQIKKWKEDPELRIAGTSTDSARKTVTLWVYGLTPENQRLDGTMIDGWGIIVAQSPMPADKNKSREIAGDYLLNSFTFRFDGIEDSLKLVDTNTLDCPYCWEFVFEFQCQHAGYGNRTGQMLAQVITPHTARIVVEQGRVTSAIMDGEWDMLAQKMIDSNKPVISVSSSVFEGEKDMAIYGDGRVTSREYHIYPNSKRITIREGHISKEEINALLELFSNLTEYRYIVNLSENTGEHIFEPRGNIKISCRPLNKTLSLRLRPPSFQEPETATQTAKEILERIDKIYAEAEISEIREEIAGPYGIALNLEPYAESYCVNQIITFNASLKWLPFTNRTKSHDKTLRYSYSLPDNYTVEWNFGDGSKGYGEIVSHSYSSPGNYRVKLRVGSTRGGAEIHGTEIYRTINITCSTPNPTRVPAVPGFVAVFTIAGSLAVAYLLRRRK